MLKKLFIFFFLSFLLIFSERVFAQPLSAKFYTSTLDAKVGDEINLQLKINPRVDMPVYTVSADLMYDPGVLEYVSSEYTDAADVFGVQKPPYFLEDTESGMIRLTAGFPEGANTLRNFTNYKFKAKKTGTTKIYIQNGKALNAESNDIGLQQKEITLNISENIPEPVFNDEIITAEALPPQDNIYNIELKLDILGPLAIYKEDGFTFPIDTAGTIGNTDGKIKIYVYNEKTELFFQEEKTIDPKVSEPVYFTIPPNTLTEGNFVISVETIDNDGQSRIIAQKEIGVLSNGETWMTKNKDYLIPVFIFIALLALIHHIMRDRDLYFRLKDLRKTKPKTTKRTVKKAVTSRRF
jgi:hypothetical protein